MPEKSKSQKSAEGPDKAFILAAGFGTRMKPLTDKKPKPLMEVAGETLLDRALDHLEEVDVKEVVINTHYLGDQIKKSVAKRKAPKTIISHEEKLLDTGGGIKNALSNFKDSFYVLSGDGLWRGAALKELAAAWDPEKMDILILLQPLSTFILTKGAGDYDILKDGRARRSITKSGSHMFTSMRINHPRIFKNAPDGPFSYLDLMDAAERTGRLYAIVNSSDWHHISTPADLAAVNQAFQEEA